MAKREYQRRTRARRFGQLMLLAAALMNPPLSLAERDSDAADAGKAVVPAQNSRELLLYLGEFDPELDPIEISQMDDAPENTTDLETAVEASTHEPKN